MKMFRDRNEAGEFLALKLEEMGLGGDCCVLALPRGGVPVAARVAEKLQCPLDLLFVKKIGAPRNSEFAIGAVSETEVIWQQESIDYLKIGSADLDRLQKNKQKELKSQLLKWRHGRPSVDVKDKTVIVVDDGLATGLTMSAALRFLKKQSPKRIVVAVPVASHSAMDETLRHCDNLVVLESPSPFFSVGQWYEDFTQVSDAQVEQLIAHGHPVSAAGHAVLIPYDKVLLEGELIVPEKAKGLVIFAHGSGSTHKSPRNQKVASALNQFGFATLLFDLLSPQEASDRANVFNVPLLADRLRNATAWAHEQSSLTDLPVGYFGASTGAAAALAAASGHPEIKSIVSRGGRPDLAAEYLKDVSAKVLLIVGGEDHAVIELNKRAKMGLYACRLATIPGAGHLFEEGNTLDDVIEYACNWFTETLVTSDIESTPPPPRKESAIEVQNQIQPLTDDGISELARAVAGAKVVMLGEATHGTEEFYKFRRLISQKLIADHGFKFIAVEGDWPDCHKLNAYIQSGQGNSARAIMSQFRRWPTWMWANEQTEEMIEFMRRNKAGFYGLDVYSLYESIEVVKEYAQKFQPELRRQILEAYSCFESSDKDEIAYSRSLLKYPEGCEAEALDSLRTILRIRLEESGLFNDQLFDAQQNARTIRNAERYYSSMLKGDAESWNIRDEHMMETLLSLLQYYGDDAKAIVWAHNTHIGDYHATEMRDAGYINLGGLAREKLGADNVRLIGFGTYEGEVLAGRAWDALPEDMKLPKAAKGSYEYYFHTVAQRTGIRDYYVQMKDTPSLTMTKGHRAVGVVYQSVFEQHGKNYVPTQLSKRYDTFVFVDRTTALKAFPRRRSLGLLPETWPTGT